MHDKRKFWVALAVSLMLLVLTGAAVFWDMRGAPGFQSVGNQDADLMENSESRGRFVSVWLIGVLAGALAGAVAGVGVGARFFARGYPFEEADRHKDWFISMLGHELRNPLAPIRSAVQILELEPPPDPRVVELRDVIKRQVRQLERLIDDLLDVSRIRRGLLELKKEKLDFVDLVRETAADYEGPLTDRQIQLEVSLPEESVWINGDRTRMTQVIGNLLQNAAKFTNPGGRVYVDLMAQSESRRVLLEVRDSGVGMGQSTLDAVFRPFQQGKSAPGRGAEGLGLGLALVKGLVDLHGGEVRAFSQGKGCGSEFTVRLPLADA